MVKKICISVVCICLLFVSKCAMASQDETGASHADKVSETHDGPGKSSTSNEDKVAESDGPEDLSISDICERNDSGVSLNSPYASLNMGVLLDAGYEYLPDARQGGKNTFSLSHARLMIDGHLLSDNLLYALSMDLAAMMPPVRKNGPMGEMLPSGDDTSMAFLMDAKITWLIPGIGASFSIGRFVPSWGLLMPEKVSRLGAISFPLYIHGGRNALGRFRNVGMALTIDIIDDLSFEAGVFNGGKNSWNDENDAKDIVAGLYYSPVAGLKIRGSSFVSFPNVEHGTDSDGILIENKTETRIQPILEARYNNYGADFIVGGAMEYIIRAENDSRSDDIAFGVLAHAGYFLVGDWFQLFARFELWEPSTIYGWNHQIRLSAGPQFFLESIHSQLKINYIFDKFAGAYNMCIAYLEADNCVNTTPQLVTEAKPIANTLLIHFIIDI